MPRAPNAEQRTTGRFASTTGVPGRTDYSRFIVRSRNMKIEKKSARYSIIIPTRNKAQYLPFALQSVLSIERNDVEIIVSNNHSADGTAAYLATVSDPRLRVVSPPVDLPMSLHYEFAISQATGEWLTLLGDDDAVMPYIFDRLDELTRQYDQISVIASARAYYFWPGCEDRYGNLVVQYSRSKRAALRSTRRDLLAALAGTRSCFDLPQIYTCCIVKRSLVEKIKNASQGRFYHSITPDIYSSVAICTAEQSYLRTEEPLFWVGTSNLSMGRSDRIYRDSERFEDSEMFPPIRLHPDIPEWLHALKIGSLYLYESLLCCPISTNAWKSPSINALVYSDVLHNQRTLVAPDTQTVPAIESQINATGVSRIKIKAAGIIVKTINIVRKFSTVAKRMLNTHKGKSTGQRDEDGGFLSIDRNVFHTITQASDAVKIVSGMMKPEFSPESRPVFLMAPGSQNGAIFGSYIAPMCQNLVAAIDDSSPNRTIFGATRWDTSRFLRQARRYSNAIAIDFSSSTKGRAWVAELCREAGVERRDWLDYSRSPLALYPQSSETL